MSILAVFNIIGIILGFRLLRNREDLFKGSGGLHKEGLDFLEISYCIIVFSIIGNILFLTNIVSFGVYQILGGLASCVVLPFLDWTLGKVRGEYGKPI